MDIEHTHVCAAGTVKALTVATALAAAVAAGAGPNVDIHGTKGTALVILDVGPATAGSSESLQATLYESDDQSTWTAVPSSAFLAVGATSNDGIQTLAIRPGERKRWLSMGYADTGSGSWPVSAHILYLP